MTIRAERQTPAQPAAVTSSRQAGRPVTFEGKVPQTSRCHAALMEEWRRGEQRLLVNIQCGRRRARKAQPPLHQPFTAKEYCFDAMTHIFSSLRC
ncbi:hypothetical protein E2C01_094279 [Portunus trituberculatus]|uniref:Uncharacterized protein n=1 Tax=Portunus trituberculatus TaxID=210409 RepID=A0A5B7JWR2_PORTR|nr:hypothetical protein [Portunus trituberculatus]